MLHSMNYPDLFHLPEKSQQDKNNCNPWVRSAKARQGTPSQYLQTQQRVKNPGHAWLDRKNALTDGPGQIIFTLDVYRCTTWNILFNQITCGTQSSPLPYVPPATRRKPSQSFARFIVRSADPPCTSIRVHRTRVHRKFHLFPKLPKLSENIALCGMQTRQVLVPPLVNSRLQRLGGNSLLFFPRCEL